MRLQTSLFFVLLTLCFSACEEPIDIVLPSENPQIVIISNFSPDDEYISVFLSQERPLFSDSTTYISDAQVQISINDRVIGSMIPVAADGTYPNQPYFRSSFVPRVNRTYTLEVEIDGFPKIRATGSIPDPVPIQNVRLDSVVTSRPNLDRREILYNFYGSITINDPADVENYYHFAETILPVDWYTTLGADTIFTRNDEYFLAPVFNIDTQDPNILSLEHEYGFLLKDTDFDGQEKTIPFRAAVAFDPRNKIINSVNVLFRSVSADYYRYHSTYTRQLLAQESPFSEPVIVFNNVENGLGNFSGYSTAIDSVVVAR